MKNSSNPHRSHIAPPRVVSENRTSAKAGRAKVISDRERLDSTVAAVAYVARPVLLYSGG
jgi:hypothetical protein